jgi:hypothetical protein
MLVVGEGKKKAVDGKSEGLEEDNFFMRLDTRSIITGGN